MSQKQMEYGAIEGQAYDQDVRRYYDTVTWLAEVMPGSMRTPFEYRFDGKELYSDCGSPLEKIFDDSIMAAENLPDYELRRRKIEKEEYLDMIRMAKGELPNTIVSVSDFPPELMHADQDVGGYNVSRKQTMLRVIVRNPEGTLSMYSQSLDGSNRKALESIYSSLGFVSSPGELLGQRMSLEVDEHEQDFLVDKLTGVYDRSLQSQLGGEWYAGQRTSNRVNTYDFVCQQEDLLNAYFSRTDNFTGGRNDYNLAAAMKGRFNGESSTPPITYKVGGVVAQVMAIHEMQQAGRNAMVRGEVFSGCGASVSSILSDNANLSAVEQLNELGYGNKTESVGSDKYGSLKFTCPKKGCVNIRPRNKLIPKCQVCKADVACR